MRTLPDGTQLVATQPISSKPEVCPRIDAPVPADVVVTCLRKFPGRRRHRSCRGLDVLTTKIRLLSAMLRANQGYPFLLFRRSSIRRPTLARRAANGWKTRFAS